LPGAAGGRASAWHGGPRSRYGTSPGLRRSPGAARRWSAPSASPTIPAATCPGQPRPCGNSCGPNCGTRTAYKRVNPLLAAEPGGQVADDRRAVEAPVLDHQVVGLVAPGGHAGQVDAGHVGFHGLGIVYRGAGFRVDLDAQLDFERMIRLVTRHGQHEVTWKREAVAAVLHQVHRVPLDAL